MISSMTGFGRAQQVVEGREITVEVKSVNHRFFEFAARTPRAYGYLEEKLKGFFQQAVSRGKMEAAVTIQTLEGPSARVLVNQELAGAYVEGLRRTGQALGLQDDLTLSALARFGDIFTLQRQEEDEDAVWQAVQGAAPRAPGWRPTCWPSWRASWAMWRLWRSSPPRRWPPTASGWRPSCGRCWPTASWTRPG